jgi:hypothetical protein
MDIRSAGGWTMWVGLRLGAGLGDSAQIISGIATAKTMIKLSMVVAPPCLTNQSRT